MVFGPRLIHVIWSVAFLLALTSWSCGYAPEGEGSQDKKPEVVVTLSFLEDMVRQVAGGLVEVRALVPVGVEPENYEPLPGDVKAMEEAGAIIYIGESMERWLSRVVSDLHIRDNAFALMDRHDLDLLPLPEGPLEREPDPHIWTDLGKAQLMVDTIGEILSELVPHERQILAENSRRYRAQMAQLEDYIREKTGALPPDRRILITSELCFQYFARAYGFSHHSIWPINAPEEGTPAQISRIVDLVRDTGVPAVFLESQVDPRPMNQVSRETGVPIGGVLFSDSLSAPGEGGETFLEMMRSNIDVITRALGRETH